MALYELKDATLNGVEGQGYAFPVDTYQGKSYRGVFFSADNDGTEALVAAAQGDTPVAFAGTVYHKTTESEDTLDVDVTNTVEVAVGARADFEVVDG